MLDTVYVIIMIIPEKTYTSGFILLFPRRCLGNRGIIVQVLKQRVFKFRGSKMTEHA